jgi:hypothetical protein
MSAVLYDSTCWIKYGGGSTSFPSAGRMLCVPSNNPTPPEETTIETHGPYQHGGGFPAVNGGGGSDPQLFKSNIPLSLTQVNVGLDQNSVFASEFGCSVFSSFESMTATLAPNHWGPHAGLPGDNCTKGFENNCTAPNGGVLNPMSERNYPCDNIITVYFNAWNFDAVGEFTMKKATWQCMIGQALVMKQDIETRRSVNQMGHLIWQFNEVWATGGWGSVEYGPASNFASGQVVGGRWKPLHYWYKASLFQEVMATCNNGLCYLRNDRSGLPVNNGRIHVSSVSLIDGSSQILFDAPVNMAPGPAVIQWFNINPVPVNQIASTVLLSQIWDSDGTTVLSNNVILLTTPGNMTGLARNPTVSLTVAPAPSPDGTVAITVTSDKTLLYFTMTTLAAGRFNDNAVLLLPGTTTFTFIPVINNPVDMDLLTSSIRFEHVATYM